MKISIIAAMSENRVIGSNNRLPWKLPADLRYFKAKTMGKTLVMGRKTFESLQKFLAGRRIIVMTRDQGFSPQGAEKAHSLEQALRLAADEQEILIAGGSEIYALALQEGIVDTIYLTLIHHEFQGDAFFPELTDSAWALVSREDHQADSQNPYSFSFLVYTRMKRGWEKPADPLSN